MENIILEYDAKDKRIEEVKFLSSGCVSTIEKAFDIQLPDLLDNFPPEVLRIIKDKENIMDQNS